MKRRSATRALAPAAAAAGTPTGTPVGRGEVRIIGGQWKRTRLPVAQQPGLRPTPDRVRETLFNWLGSNLTGWRCLDAFAGTGALGLEAASRGANVELVESDPALVARLCAVLERLQVPPTQQVVVQRGDGIAALRQSAPASLELILLDPPFVSDLFIPALQAARRAVAPQGFVYLEAPHLWDAAALAPLGFAAHRTLRAGAVHAHLLQPAELAQDAT